MPCRAIMFQGTGSNVGKSVLVAGIARALANRGHTVRPFKPQNMSNNAAVTSDGGEIGRAQALQARAARVDTNVHMNPVLLKPNSEVGAQIVVQGQVVGGAMAREFQSLKPSLMPKVLESFNCLRGDADFVVVEGAGSASETNLRKGDIANMGFAAAADVPVVLIGDIDRGGVIASLVGTMTVVEPADAALVEGFIVNKMRGDLTLFADGMADISNRTGLPALGLVPFFEPARHLPAEDAFDLSERRAHPDDGPEFDAAAGAATEGARLKIAVPLLPRIANFDDLDPLAAEPAVDLVMVERGDPIPMDCDLVILPGSKSTIADLECLRSEGWDIDILAHRRKGGRILGLCGGFQMLGRRISDPEGIEGPAQTVDGLGLLDIETVLAGPKQVERVSGHSIAQEIAFTGYEIHMGRTSGAEMNAPIHELADGRQDGAQSEDGRVVGSYVHGIFNDDAYRTMWLNRFGVDSRIPSHDLLIDRTLDDLAQHLEDYVDIDRLIKLAR